MTLVSQVSENNLETVPVLNYSNVFLLLGGLKRLKF
jgi:hypothetical protein